MERTFLASPNFELRMCRKALNETIASVMRNIPVQLINFTENRAMTEHIETFTSLARDFTQMHSTPGHTPSAAANMPHTDVPTQTTHHDTAYTSCRSADLKVAVGQAPRRGNPARANPVPAARSPRVQIGGGRYDGIAASADWGSAGEVRGRRHGRRNRVRTDDAQICSSYAAVGASCEQRLGGKV